ncbi:MAG TPA: AraC family transcriptional regulator [bacterium]|nr:AraC family transcriptional regulator [bacterium]
MRKPFAFLRTMVFVYDGGGSLRHKKHPVSASTTLTRILLRYAASLGVDVQTVTHAAGLSASVLDDAQGRVSVEQFNALWDEIAHYINDPDFGLHFGETASTNPNGNVLYAVLMNSATVGEALECYFRYHALMLDVLQPQLIQQGDNACLTWDIVVPGLVLHRHHAEAVLATLMTTLQHLTEDQIRLIEVWFAHPQPQDIAEHCRIFHTPLRFNQLKNGLVIHQKELSRPIFLADPDLLIALEQFAQQSLENLYGPDTWADKVIHAISNMLLHGDKPSIAQVARDLAVSKRHLQNKLSDEGTTYRALLDRVRKEITLDSLHNPHMNLCDIAFLLGFAEQSTFNHAFKRWTGVAPTVYQQQKEAQ